MAQVRRGSRGFFQRLFDGDPETNKRFSSFLLGFSRNLTAANQQGLPPLASIAFGFGGGGDAIQAFEDRQGDKRDQALARQFKELQIRQAQAKEKRDKTQAEARSTLFGALDPTRELAAQAFPQKTGERFVAQLFPERNTKSFKSFYRPRSDGSFEIEAARAGSDEAEQLVKNNFIPGTPPEQTTFEQTVSSLERQGKSRDEAVNIASGLVSVGPNPVTGRQERINQATGEVTELGQFTLPPSNLERLEPVGVGNTFGPTAIGKRLVGSTLGLVIKGAQSPEAAVAQSRIVRARAHMRRANTISTRPPVIELTDAVKGLPADGVFSAIGEADAKMNEISSQLRLQLADDLRIANMQGVSNKLRQEAQARAIELNEALAIIESFEGVGPQSLPKGVPEGSTVIDRTSGGARVYKTPDGRLLKVVP